MTNNEAISELLELQQQLREADRQLSEAKNILNAIREGDIDALLISESKGKSEQVYILQGADRVYHEIVEEMQEGFITINQDGVILFSNRNFANLLHYSLEQVIGISIYDLIIPEEMPILRQFMQFDIENIKREFRLKNAAGCSTPVLLSMNPCAHGQQVAYIIVADLTETLLIRQHEEDRKISEAVLLEKNRLSSLINSISDEVWFIDTEKKFTLANPSAVREFKIGPAGTSVAEMVSSLEILRPDGSPRPEEEAPPVRALNGELVQNQQEIVRTPATGELRYREITANPVRDAGGNVIGSVAVARDITDRKRAEEALRESQEWYEAVMQQSSDAIAIVDIDSKRIVEINRSFSQIFGYSTNEVVGIPIGDLGLLGPEDVADMGGTLASGRPWSNPIRRYPGKNGQVIYFEMASSLMRLQNKSMNILCIRDVTEKQKSQAEMQRQVDLAGTIQRSMLPPDYRDEKLTIQSAFHPLTLVSGDFYGYRWSHAGNKLHGYLIDVTGHGLATALYTSAISSLANEMMDMEEAWTSESLNHLNHYASVYFPDDTFVALMAFTFDFQRNLMTCVSGGINYILASTQNRRGLIPIPGIYLGIMELPNFNTVTIPFQSSDTFYFMTDGFYDRLPDHMVENADDFETTVKGFRYPEIKYLDDCAAICIQIGRLNSFPIFFDLSNPDKRGEIREQISAVLRDLAGTHAPRIETVLGEALMNAVRHGTHIQVKINKIGIRLILRVKHDGRGFGGNSKLNELRKLRLEHVFESMLSQGDSRGIPIMLAWTDRMLYNDKGNEVMLIKNI